MAILDFAGASQATVSFVTNYGHRLYSDDFVRQLDRVFGSAPAGANDAEFFENQANPALVSDFFELALNFDGPASKKCLVLHCLRVFSRAEIPLPAWYNQEVERGLADREKP